ncbi:hypothetical protein BS50DRAFT_655637 [Corynespora cassiicola Philippines]|uniref:Uncharacterized protein n=1 Tax=Corynespora cassiicola Philippines TaxID=1448308 RepID=A0A2T2N4X8_CORCC|nr:hypothetical protein BS50DRAFT_655637 [Corynespora cassiicola Philippines]
MIPRTGSRSSTASVSWSASVTSSSGFIGWYKMVASVSIYLLIPALSDMFICCIIRSYSSLRPAGKAFNFFTTFYFGTSSRL